MHSTLKIVETAETFYAPCKINLFLHIVGRKDNGYHLLESLFYPLKKPCDTIEIKVLEKEEKKHIKISCSSDSQSIDIEKIDLENNTLTKAYTLFCEKTDFCLPLEIYLKKAIPHGAGLGGGSSDAALLLKYLYKKWQKKDYHNANRAEKIIMQEIALKVGADVPFFLEEKEKHVSGIGEILEHTDLAKDFPFFHNKYLFLLCPHISVNTVWAFNEFRQQNQNIEKNIKKNAQINLTKINKKDIHLFNARAKVNTTRIADTALDVKKLYRNDLEETVFSHYPLLKEYKEKLYDFQADLALMSGSGSSLFALFQNKEEAQKAEEYFKKIHSVTCFPSVLLR